MWGRELHNTVSILVWPNKNIAQFPVSVTGEFWAIPNTIIVLTLHLGCSYYLVLSLSVKWLVEKVECVAPVKRLAGKIVYEMTFIMCHMGRFSLTQLSCDVARGLTVDVVRCTRAGCDVTFKTFALFSNHMCRAHDLVPYTLIRCVQCERCFRTEKSHEWHVKHMHGEERLCDKCDFVASSKAMLK